MSLHIQYKFMSWAALPKEVIWLIKSIHSDPKRRKNHGVLRIGESKKYFLNTKYPHGFYVPGMKGLLEWKVVLYHNYYNF